MTFFTTRRGQISIHVPLAGNVPSYAPSPCEPCYFYPRSPCGERLKLALLGDHEAAFLSTFPLRGTSESHALIVQLKNFYPRSPCGERLNLLVEHISLGRFLSTFPLRGTSANCDRLLPLVCKSIGNSKHSVLATWLTRGVITPDSLSGMGAKISGGF